MTEEQFINLSESDFLEIWNIFQKESKYKTNTGTPVGFGEFLKTKYNLNLDSIVEKIDTKLHAINTI